MAAGPGPGLAGTTGPVHPALSSQTLIAERGRGCGLQPTVTSSLCPLPLKLLVALLSGSETTCCQGLTLGQLFTVRVKPPHASGGETVPALQACGIGKKTWGPGT